MRRLADAGDHFAEESISITVENVEKLRGKRGVSGVHIMPLGWEEAIAQVIDRAGLMPGLITP
jgi:methylenetetrahydrofolate reductase (NADPH)